MGYLSYAPTIIRCFHFAVLFFPGVSVPFSEPCVMGVIVVIVIPVALSDSRKDASGSGLLVTGYLNNIFIFIQAWTPLDIGSQILPRRIPIPPKAKLICGSADQRVICNFLCARVCVIVPRPWKRRPNMLAFAGWRTFWGQLPGGSDTRAPIAWYLRLGSSFPSAGSILWNILVWLLQLN